MPLGGYGLAKQGLSEHRYRLGHPLAQHAIASARTRQLDGAELVFDYSNWPAKSIAVEPLVGCSGSLAAYCLSVSGFDSQDHILLAARTSDGTEVDPAVIRRLFEMPCSRMPSNDTSDGTEADTLLAKREAEILDLLKEQQSHWFAEESQKLEKWADDKVFAAEKELQDAKTRIRDLKREGRAAASPEEQHRIQKQIQDLEKTKRRLRQRIFEVEDEIIEERDRMIAELETRLKQDISKEKLFTIHWSVV